MELCGSVFEKGGGDRWDGDGDGLECELCICKVGGWEGWV